MTNSPEAIMQRTVDNMKKENPWRSKKLDDQPPHEPPATKYGKAKLNKQCTACGCSTINDNEKKCPCCGLEV